MIPASSTLSSPTVENGQLATFAEFSRDAKLSMTLTVTPADYTTCEWFLDGKKVNEGKSIEQRVGSRHLRPEDCSHHDSR